jgi:beta-glucanase (GH16 family)
MGDRILEELPGWSLAWSDEFDGAAGSPVDPASWQPQLGGHGWGNQELQYYTNSSANAALDGAGNLAITVRRTDPQLRDRRFGGCPYTSARLVTKDRVSCTYGLVQARIRLPQGRGVWPAFWMLGQDIDRVGWPHCGEIDVMENFGKDPTVTTGQSTARATPAPPALPPPTRPIPAWPTTSTYTRSTGNPDASAGTWTTTSTAP